MSVSEVDRNVPPIGNVPATKIERQHFKAHATGNGTTLAGTYTSTGTLENGLRCRSGRVRFTAAIHRH
jgi:hypothetical protein